MTAHSDSFARNRLRLSDLRPLPLAERHSLTRAESLLDTRNQPPPKVEEGVLEAVTRAESAIRQARERDASVILIYGAHLLRNGAGIWLDSLMSRGWITHLATNGAGTIHDWEYAWLGRSTECVRSNVAKGTFGTWEETGRTLHLAMAVGALEELGWGGSLGRLIETGTLEVPDPEVLFQSVQKEPRHPLAMARLEAAHWLTRSLVPPGRVEMNHPWKAGSILGSAWRHEVPFSVHPGIGYDIIACHPGFNGAILGWAAQLDFGAFGAAVERLDGGVVLSIGSAIMGPQVFEKSLSCVHNLRFQKNLPPVRDFEIHVVDLQDGGGWDWTQGEPPKENPAYYLRFCKSYARMGATMRYVQADNYAFIRHLEASLCPAES